MGGGQRVAPHFLHLRVGGVSGESSIRISLFLQFLGIFTLRGTGAQISCEFGHRFFRRLSLCFSWRMRGAFRRVPRACFGLFDRKRKLLGARNNNPRQSSLLIGAYVFLVVVLNFTIASFVGLFLQGAAQFLGKNLHTRKVHLFIKCRLLIQAAFLG